jgi:signal recognition particle subunit SEC65
VDYPSHLELRTLPHTSMIHHMFVFGVVIPTLVTVVVFVGFLICWFKFNIHDRLFKKKFLAKSMKKLPPHLPVARGPMKVVKFSNKDNNKDDNGDDGDDEDDGNDDSGTGTVCTDSGNDNSPKNLEEALDEGSICGDVETALCISENCQNEEIEGFSNPNMCVCQSPSGIRTEVTRINSMVQHTFHFPDQLSSIAADSEADSEDGNYGHFVPLSQALKDPKTRQMYEAARGLGLESEQVKEMVDAMSPKTSPVKHKGCTKMTTFISETESEHLMAEV